MSRRIRTILILAFLGLAVLPVVVVSLVLASVGFSSLADRSIERQREVARRVAGDTQGLLERQIQGLQQFDSMNDLLMMDRDQRLWRMMRYMSANPLIGDMAILDVEGREQARINARQVLRPGDYRDLSAHPLVRAARAGRRILAGEVNFDPLTGEPSLPVVMPLIERHTGELDGLLMAHLRFAPVWNLLARMDLMRDETVYVLDVRKRVIAHPNPSVVLRDTTVDLPSSDGLVRLAGAWRMLGRDERRIAQQPFVVVVERSAFQALRPAFLNLAVTGCVLVASLMAVGVLLGLAHRRILAPLQELVDATHDVQQGDLNRAVQVVHDDEIGDLGRAFNLMTGRLRGLIDELREEIAHRQLAEGLATENQKRLQEIIDQAPAVIYLKDNQGRFILVNRRHRDLLGRGDADIIGKTDFDLFPAETATAFVANDRMVLSSGRAANWEETLVQPDGTRTYLSVKFPIRNVEGEVIGLCGMSTDITERKMIEDRLRRSEADIRAILDNMVDTFFRTDRAGRLTMLSRSVEPLLGYMPDDLIGRRLADFCIRAEDERRLREELRASGEVVGYRIAMRHRDGREIWVSFNAQVFGGDGRNGHGNGHGNGDGNGNGEHRQGIEGTARNVTQLIRDEEALKASEGRLRDIAESLSDWIWETDAEHRFSFVSERFTELSGVTVGELLGRRLWEVAVPDAEYGEDCDDLRAAFERGRPFRDVVCRYLDSRGGERYWRISAKPIFDANRRLSGFRGAASDVTRLRESEVLLRKLSQAIEQSPVSVIIANTDGTIEYVNPRFTQVTGYRADEAIGRNPRFLKSGYTSGDDYAQMWRTITAGQEWHGEFHNRRKNGSLFWESASISPLKDENGRITHFLAVKEDISEIKAAEAALIQAKDEAEAASRAKSHFLANMSHELRTPLNGIIGFADMLKAEYFGGLNPRQHEYLADIRASGEHLLDLIGTILDLSRIEAGRHDLADEDLDLGQVVERCLAMVRGEAIEAHIVLAHRVPADLPHLRGDARAVRQIVLNLLSNALKFTEAEGRVTIEARLRDDGGLSLEVADTGVGIAPEVMERIFEPFQQGDALLSRLRGGAGLGLTISRGLMEIHGGVLTLSSTPGVGTTATAAFPAGRTVRN